MRLRFFIPAIAVAISCTGEDGAPGAAGPRGIQGLPGPMGNSSASTAVSAYAVAGSAASTPYRPLLWVSCVSDLDIVGNDAIVETVLSYKFTVFTNGDVSTSCYVSLGSAETASSSGYYPSTTVGADEAGCGAALDYPPEDAIAGHWEFSAASGPVVVYEDASSNPLNGKTYRFTDDDCAIMRLGSNAEWANVPFNAAP